MSRLTRRGVLSGGFSSLSANLSPTSLSGASTGASVTTSGSVAMVASGGSGSYDYAWERVSGSTAVNANSAASAATSFTATGMSELETRSTVWRGQVTDSVTGASTYTEETVSIVLTRNQAALSASLSPANLDGSGSGTTVTTSGSVTVTASGGSGSYSYAWERVSGSTVPAPANATAASTTFSTSSIASGANQTTVWRCVVTDTVNLNSTPTGNVTVSLTRGYASLSVSVAPTSLSGSGANTPVVTSGSATATVTGGSGNWTGAWEWDGGATSGSIAATNATSATTTFQSGDTQAQGTSRGQGMRFRVTDGVTGAVALSNSVGVNLTRYAALSAAASPSNLSGTSDNTPVVTSGSATCTASGGSGSYTYAWEWDGGASTGAIVPVSANNKTTAFQSGDAQAPGTSRGRGFRCRVTDTVTGLQTLSNSVGVDLFRNYAAMTVSASPPSLSGSSTSAPVTTNDPASVSVSGGSGSFSYLWIYNGVGTGGINPVNVSAASTLFRSESTIAPGQTKTAGWYCRVTDNVTGLSKDTNAVSVSLTRQVSGITYADVSPATQDWPGASPFQVFVTVAHDGVGPFTYSWTANPAVGITINAPSSQSTSVSSASGVGSITIMCRVTDNGAGGAFIDATGSILDGFQ